VQAHGNQAEEIDGYFSKKRIEYQSRIDLDTSDRKGVPQKK